MFEIEFSKKAEKFYRSADEKTVRILNRCLIDEYVLKAEKPWGVRTKAMSLIRSHFWERQPPCDIHPLNYSHFFNDLNRWVLPCSTQPYLMNS